MPTVDGKWMSPYQYHVIKREEEMRQETGTAVAAFMRRETVHLARTVVDGTAIYLHGHKIAWWGDDRSVSMTLAGFPTRTTMERLNGLCERLGHGRPFHILAGRPYHDDREIGDRDVITYHPIG